MSTPSLPLPLSALTDADGGPLSLHELPAAASAPRPTAVALTFPAAGTTVARLDFELPRDYAGSAVLRIDWTAVTAQTTGSCVWSAELAPADSAPLGTEPGPDAVSAMSSLAGVEARAAVTVRLALPTAAELAPDTPAALLITRSAATGDTLGADGELLFAALEYQNGAENR